MLGDGGDDHFCVAEGRKEFRDAAKTEAMTTDHDSAGALYASPRSGGAGSGVVVRYTLDGDADLEGTVDFHDLVKLAQNYGAGAPGSSWGSGDFSYDGVVDFNDLVKLAQNYNSGVPSATPGANPQFEKDLEAAFAAAESETA